MDIAQIGLFIIVVSYILLYIVYRKNEKRKKEEMGKEAYRAYREQIRERDCAEYRVHKYKKACKKQRKQERRQQILGAMILYDLLDRK